MAVDGRPYFQRAKDIRRQQANKYMNRLDYLVGSGRISNVQAQERFRGYCDAQRQRKRLIRRGIRRLR